MDSVATTTKAVLNGNIHNLIIIIGFIFGLILIAGFFAKKGFFSFKSNFVTIGNDEIERRIIRQQMEYCKAELNSFFSELIREHENSKTFNEMKCLYCKELVYDVFVEAVYLNHITTDDFYIGGKVTKIWAKLGKVKLGSDFYTLGFKDSCQKEIEKIIKHLYEIRKYYSKVQTTV